MDTLFPGFFWKKTIEELGFFDEGLARNQDIAFNYKIGRSGGKILLTPAIKVYYYTRPTMGSLWRQNLTTGYWNIRTLIKYPGSLSLRHFIPLFFLGSIAVGSSLAIFVVRAYPIPIAIIASYLVLALLSSLSIAFKAGIIYLFPLLVVFPIIHLSYGLGSLWGIVSLLWRGVRR